ncbi:glycosyltransferase [Planomonospora algeriensis]
MDATEMRRAVLSGDGKRWYDGRRTARSLTSVEIVIPVLNEERALPGCIRTVHRFLTDFFPLVWTVTIVDNGSTDSTWETAQRLSRTMTGVRARRLERRGKGIAVKTAWRDSGADIVAFMDVDLSTGLHALLPLVSAVASGHCEIAIGTRLAGGSRIERGARRELISRLYNGMLRVGFAADFTDATCGFKAARTDVVRPILDRVEDDGWFFDTELLLVAQYNGARIVEIPVDWVEDADSRVDVWKTAAATSGGSPGCRARSRAGRPGWRSRRFPCCARRIRTRCSADPGWRGPGTSCCSPPSGWCPPPCTCSCTGRCATCPRPRRRTWSRWRSPRW